MQEELLSQGEVYVWDLSQRLIYTFFFQCAYFLDDSTEDCNDVVTPGMEIGTEAHRKVLYHIFNRQTLITKVEQMISQYDCKLDGHSSINHSYLLIMES